MKKWYENRFVAIIWTVLRIWLGIQWLEAGWHKLGGFDATGFIQGAIAKASGEAPVVQGWYAAFLENFALPNIELFNFLIPIGEVLVGICLILGVFTVPALVAGAFMNVNFLLAGTISTNPNFLVVTMILLFVYKGAEYYGLDRFFRPVVEKSVRNTNLFKRFRGAGAH